MLSEFQGKGNSPSVLLQLLILAKSLVYNRDVCDRPTPPPPPPKKKKKKKEKTHTNTHKSNNNKRELA